MSIISWWARQVSPTCSWTAKSLADQTALGSNNQAHASM